MILNPWIKNKLLTHLLAILTQFLPQINCINLGKGVKKEGRKITMRCNGRKNGERINLIDYVLYSSPLLYCDLHMWRKKHPERLQ